MNKLSYYKSLIFCTLFSFVFLTNFSAQNNTSSPYSMFGLGDIENRGSIRSSGMGGVGIALESENTINLLNPASYSGLDSMSFLFDIGVLGKFSTLKSNNHQESITDMNLSGITFGFKANKRWALSFGLLPYSSIGYRFDDEKIIEGTTISYLNSIEGIGGINQFYFGNSFKVLKNLAVGINVSYLFGNLTVNESNSIVLNSTAYSSNTESSYYLNNLYLDYGIQYHFAVKKNIFSIGAIFSNKQLLNADYSTQTLLGTGDELYLEEKSAKDIIIPQSAGIGLAFQIPEKLLISADYQIQDWTENSFLNDIADYKRSQGIRFGVEYKPQKSIGSSYFSFIDYRIGAYYTDLYYQLYDIPIIERGVSLGFGLPLRGAKINLSMEYAIKGATTKGLVEEDYFKVKLGLSLKQSWFQRRKFY